MKIAVTTGDPAGVGADIVVSLAHHKGVADTSNLVVLGDRDVLAARAELLGDKNPTATVDALNVLHIPTDAPVQAGVGDSANAAHVLRQLELAVEGARDGTFDAIVTAPVNKKVICDSGQHFVGHTDYFGERLATPTVMLFVAGQLRVALLTTHIPLSKVPAAITAGRLEEVVRIVARDTARFFRHEIEGQPRITVCGLNPHAGENGELGDEEQNILIPAIEKLCDDGFRVRGPVPADTAFIKSALRDNDVFIGMYHDQVLPLVKHIAFENAVNVTLGLPFIRTSVDHGTAFEIAGSGKANPANMLAAVALAERMCINARDAS